MPREAPLLATERLILRGWRASDRAPFARMNDDARVMEHFPARLSRAESDAFVERIQASFRDRGFGLWVVERRSDAAFLGFAGLIDQTFEAHFTPAVEVGWRLAVDAWGTATRPRRPARRFDSASSRSAWMRSSRSPRRRTHGPVVSWRSWG